MGLKEDIVYDPPCHPRACAIQGKNHLLYHFQQQHQLTQLTNTLSTACLTKNSYKEEKCQSQIDALYECCNAFYQERGDNARTPSCPKPDLLRLKMKQRAEAKDAK